jgi:hypothetical protein
VHFATVVVVVVVVVVVAAAKNCREAAAAPLSGSPPLQKGPNFFSCVGRRSATLPIATWT